MKNCINKEIAQYFITDSIDFLNRFKIFEKHSTHIGSRSKLLTELLFSTECILKALIFIESDLDEKQTYRKARKAGHNINKLINKLKPESQNKFKTLIKTDLSKFAVYNRYQLESEIDFREESGVLGKKYYNTIANFNWLNRVYEEIEKFVKYVQNKIPINLEPINFSDINIDLEQEKHYRIINIR
ncbi:MAG: hypothetical protein WD048_15250 [Chitinophagales bacterium]